MEKNEKMSGLKHLVHLISATTLLLIFCILMLSCAPPHKNLYSCREYLSPDCIPNSDSIENIARYSYVLLRPYSNDDEFNRYLTLHRAYSSFIKCTDRVRSNQKINLVLWPLRPDFEISCNEIAQIEADIKTDKNKRKFYIEQYDYPTSDSVFSKIRGLKGRGPFIVGYKSTLSVILENNPTEIGKKMLLFDLSGIHEKYYHEMLMWYKDNITENKEVWQERNRLNWNGIKTRIKSATYVHGGPIIHIAVILAEGVGGKEAQS